jgi:peptidoglycan/LPS O-acetylase OafA/YrhL
MGYAALHSPNAGRLERLLGFLKAPLVDPDRKRSTHGDSLFVLDGTRGLAVLIVIASHTGAFGMGGQGSLGVLLFFFLSGFVLTLPYADEPRRLVNRAELFRFAASRVLRIVPIYLVAVAVVTWLLKENLNFFLVNALFLKGWSYLWSVAEEARFYLLFPLTIAIAALLPGRLPKILYLCVLTWLAYRYRNIHQVDMLNGRHVSFYFWMFTGGMLTCLLYRWPALARVAEKRLLAGFFGVGALVTLVLVFLSSNHMVQQFWKPLIPSLPENLVLNGWARPGTWLFLFFLLVYGATNYPGSWAGRFTQLRFLRHMGLLSYSLYLFHFPIIMELQKFGFRGGEGLFVVVFVTSWVVAWFSYILVEKPFLGMKPRPQAMRLTSVKTTPS